MAEGQLEDGLLDRSVAVEGADDGPACITTIRSLKPRISGSSDEIIGLTRPFAASSPIKPVDLGLRPTSTPCVGSSRIRTDASVFRAIGPRATFCWFLLERCSTGASTDAALTPSRFDKSVATSRSLREVEHPERRDRAEGRERGVASDRHLQDHAMPSSIFRQVGDSHLDRLAG